MRVCERHPDKKNVQIIRNLHDGTEFDLCPECYEEFIEWFNKKPVQKPTDKKGDKK